MMPLVPDDFHPFQAAYKLSTQEFRLFGSRRFKDTTVPASTKVVRKGRDDLTATRKSQFDATLTAIIAQAEAETGYVVDRIMFNFDASDTDQGIVANGHYEFADGSKSGTHIKRYRLQPLTAEEITADRDVENYEEPLEVANLTTAELTGHRSLVGALKQIARTAEGFETRG